MVVKITCTAFARFFYSVIVNCFPWFVRSMREIMAKRRSHVSTTLVTVTARMSAVVLNVTSFEYLFVATNTYRIVACQW